MTREVQHGHPAQSPLKVRETPFDVPRNAIQEAWYRFDVTRKPIILSFHTQNVKTILCEESSSATEANSSPITAPSRVRNSRVIRRLATARVSLAVALVSQSLP